ncbi:MAG: serine--tRNA ligase, partial [Aridibacter sp.]
MLDLHFVRENLEIVREAFKKRHFETDALETFVELDKERREVIIEADQINQQRNLSSKEIGALMQAGKPDEAEAKKLDVAGLKEKQQELEQKRTKVETKMDELLAGLPNIPADDVPVGTDESDNKEISRWGKPREFDFEVKDHVDLGESLGILDLERATKIAGARFAILNGKGARLERALINFMLEVHTEQHGYKETLPPFIVNDKALFGTSNLPKFEED